MNHDAHTQVSTPSDRIAFDPADRELGVLVGFDGSEHAILALHYAARAALRRHAPLTVVNAFTIPVGIYSALGELPDAQGSQLRSRVAQETLDTAREYLKDYPGEVTYRSESGDAAGVLVDLSASAQVVVVGARGRGGFVGRVLGSVASALPGHSKCPTVVVPRDYTIPDAEGAARFAPAHSDQPVVVGIDGSRSARAAALIAAQAAADRAAPLLLVVALPQLEGSAIWYPDLAPGLPEVVKQRRAELNESLLGEAQWLQGHFPGLEINVTVESGEAVPVLAEASRTAQLTVVGTRGHGRLASTLLGSISRSLLFTVEGTIMVVPNLEDARLENQPASW